MKATAAAAAAALLAVAAGASAAPVPTGVEVTPLSAPGARFQSLNPGLKDLPNFKAGGAAALAVSADGSTLLVLTSGYNRNADAKGAWIKPLSQEYVFVFDLRGGGQRLKQTLTVPNTFLGLAFAPSGERFYVSGGVDDVVYEYSSAQDVFTLSRRFELGHNKGLGVGAAPEAAGVAVSPDGASLLVSNLQNDSVSLIDLASGRVTDDLDLRPAGTAPPIPGGTFPNALAFTAADQAYAASLRDRELIALTIKQGRLTIRRRIPVTGQPAALAVGAGGRRLFAALDNTDALLALDARSGEVLERITTSAPSALAPKLGGLSGVDSNNLALSRDGRTVYVTNGGQNALAVIRLSARAAGAPSPKGPHRAKPSEAEEIKEAQAVGPAPSQVVGLVPTGWYPTAVATTPDGGRIFVSNSKSDPGPNPQACRASLTPSDPDCRGANQYVWQLQTAGLLSLPTPGSATLAALTLKVAENNHYLDAPSPAERALMSALRRRIHHVVYVIKENRTYDQVLGDLEVGDGDPALAILGRVYTPNHHALARTFVDLDAFYDPGESSNTGWNWSTAARTNDFTEREAPVNYAGRGLQYDQEGDNRNINVGVSDPAERIRENPATPSDPRLLAGGADVSAPDAPDGSAGEGYLWNAALRAGLSVRNWGFYGDLSRYESSAGAARIPLERDPASKGLQVFFPTKAALRPVTDLYYRGFDQAFPDYWRFTEWRREFDAFQAKGSAPSLMLVRLAHDHTGAFGRGLDGVSTVETEVADNDYALGRLVESVATSRFAADTLIFVVEDDAQDGPDHVDAHRSLALVAGPFVRRGAVVSTRYSTINLLRTIEEILGLSPLSLNDAMARPMTDVFDLDAAAWTYKATASTALRSTSLPIPPSAFAEVCPAPKGRSALYWAKAMNGQDFSSEDRLDTPAFNRALWRGLAEGRPSPQTRGGEDLRGHRPGSACSNTSSPTPAVPTANAARISKAPAS